MSAPIESKVSAASAATLIAGFVVAWVVTSVPALASLSDVLQAAIAAVVTTAFTFAAGWAAKHTPRLGVPPRDGSYGR